MIHDRFPSGNTCNGNDGNVMLEDGECKALLIAVYATSVKVQQNLVVRSVGLRKRSKV